MKRINKTTIATLLLLTFCIVGVSAQGEENKEKKSIFKKSTVASENKPWTFRPYWSTNYGLTTSFGAPAETREIKSSSLQINYIFGCDVIRMFSDKWGIATGLRYERKGGNSCVVMKNYLTTITLVGDGTPTYGYFSGTVETKCDIKYLSLPVMAFYRATKRLDVHGGLYFSYALDRKYQTKAYDGKIRETPLVPAVGVTESYSDFSDKITQTDMGIEAGISYLITKHLDINADINWGLVNVLNAPESGMTKKVYNLYASIGIGWRF